jgi:bifunctional DNA-binding transcriptional regulator/antitoxin component of YhaV-PrlF toxin-antitoxin module
MPATKETTKVQLAQVNSKSLRTTIPAGIVRQFGIEEGTDLEWGIEPRDNQLLIVVRPLAAVAATSATTGTVATSTAPTPTKRGKGKRAAGDA